MRYFDLHCDALSVRGAACVTKESLTRGGCALQCFAAFVPEGEDRFARALSLLDGFDVLCKENGYLPVRTAADLDGLDGRIGALLTVEGGGAIEGDLRKLDVLYRRGVRLMTLTWNDPNEIGFPNFSRRAGTEDGRRLRERERGLTPFGREVLERMTELGMAADVSHGSDRLVWDVFEICRARGKPFLASHSNAAAVYPHARNLEDDEIRLIAESGGVVGLCFCMDFLSSDRTKEGQRAALFAHAEQILKVGGEDTLCLGSDFDGIEPNICLQDPSAMPLFLEELSRRFSAKTAEKIAYSNARRFFKEILNEK